MGVTYTTFLVPRPVGFRPRSDAVVRLVDALRSERWLPTSDAPGFAALRAPLQGGAAGMARRAHRWAGKRELTAGRSVLPDPLTAAWLDAHPETRLEWPVHPDETLLADDLEMSADGPELYATLFGARYPLLPMQDDWPYFDFAIDWVEDYVDPQGLETMGEGDCPCGYDELGYSDTKASDGSFISSPFHGGRIRAVCPVCRRRFEPSSATTTIRAGWSRAETVLGEGGALYRFAIIVDCGKSFPPEPPLPRFNPELRALCERVIGCPFVEAARFD